MLDVDFFFFFFFWKVNKNLFANMYMSCKVLGKIKKNIHMVPRVRKNEFKMSLRARPIRGPKLIWGIMLN